MNFEFQSEKRFSEELLNLISTSENKKSLKEKIKEEYKVLLSSLSKEIEEELKNAEKAHNNSLASIEKTRVDGINNIESKFASLNENEKTLKENIVEHDNAIKGINIVAKRARIKENNDYDLLLKDIKLKKLYLYNDYAMLLKVATGKESRLKNTINTMIIE